MMTPRRAQWRQGAMLWDMPFTGSGFGGASTHKSSRNLQLITLLACLLCDRGGLVWVGPGYLGRDRSGGSCLVPSGGSEGSPATSVH
jgi:hypothetical protein